MLLTKEQWDTYRQESYALERERLENLWHENYDARVIEIKNEFDTVLQAEDTSGYCKLDSFFSDPEFTNIYANEPDMIYMYLSYHIFKYECAGGESKRIYDVVRSLSDLLDLFQNMKYKIWRIEFCHERDAVSKLLTYIEEMGISMTAVQHMIMICAYDKTCICEQLAQTYLNMGKRKHARSVLELLAMMESEVSLKGENRI